MPSITESEIVFEAVGTRGDVAPLMAIASALAIRGHSCRLLANHVFEAEARSLGLEFNATSPQTLLLGDDERCKRENYLFLGIERALAAFRRLPRKPALVVNIDRFSASSPIAEALGIPVCRIHLSPFKIRSLVAPAWPLGKKAMGPLGRSYLKYSLPRFYEACDTDSRILTFLNGRRTALGLDPVRSASYEERHVWKHLALFPPWFCQPASDWPAGIQMLGFPVERGAGDMPNDVLRFVRREGAPIVFTPGTGVSNVQAFFECAALCCQRLGRPGLFLSPFLPSGRGDDSRILRLDYVDLSLVLNEAALLVHHGGIGTTARALQAGIPQIISPMGFDQPDNGHRVDVLGVGSVLERAQLSEVTLTREATRLLEDSGVAQNLSRVRRMAIEWADGVERAADRIEELFQLVRFSHADQSTEWVETRIESPILSLRRAVSSLRSSK